MPAIKPDRVLADLYKLRTFGTYKTGVHRPTFSPEDIAARQWFPDACAKPGSTPRSTASANPRQVARERPQGTVRLALESQNQAGWLEARSAASTRWKPRARSARRAANGVDVVGVLRRGGAFRLIPRQPVVHRRADRRGHRQGPATATTATPMREALKTRRLCGPSAPA